MLRFLKDTIQYFIDKYPKLL